MSGTRDERGRWVKGAVANPNGRPLKTKLDDLADARKAAMAILQDEMTAEDWRAIVRKQIEQAKNGSFKATQFLASYVLGAPPDVVAAAKQQVLVNINWGGSENVEID